VDDVDQRLLHRGTAILGALAPNADDSTVVGEADVADDGAQKAALGVFCSFRLVIASGSAGR
jgi:hypothetical protein